MKVINVVAARPNFMKVAPIAAEMRRHPEIAQRLVHTGQHYSAELSGDFLRHLGLPEPDVNLEVGSASHAVQTAEVMKRFEPVLLEDRPDLVLVVGDVNSTLAAALTAAKLGVPVAHVEAGLRSFDRTMPEEINRVLTDHLADLLFTTEPSGNENLQREGISPDKIRFVGNTMIDTLVRLLPKAEERWPALRDRFGLDRYVLVTLHRPSNVDEPKHLREIMRALAELGDEVQVVFPVHPRTRQRISGLDVRAAGNGLMLTDPMGYLDFLALETHAGLVLTDSGGMQEETTYLGVPCLTRRPSTERPVTLQIGTNKLIALSHQSITAAAREALSSRDRAKRCPDLWDGCAGARIRTTLSE
jgi:UDP-N-acetylglucosamine 2-epimerase (non-hydrolysing)